MRIICSSDSSDISKSLSISSSILTGHSFFGGTSTSHLLVDCADRASTNSFEVGLCRTDTEELYCNYPCKILLSVDVNLCPFLNCVFFLRVFVLLLFL